MSSYVWNADYTALKKEAANLSETSTHRNFREEFVLRHTAVRISNPAKSHALRRHAITSFGAVDPWQGSDPTASRSGRFIPGEKTPFKHSAMSSMKLVLASQARLID